MSERNVELLLQDIQEAIANVLVFTEGYDLKAYAADLRTRHAVEHNFMIIGEAAARLPESYKAQNGTVDWRIIKDFRNVLVHEYFGIDNGIVWNIIQNSMPALQKNVSLLIAALKG